MRRTALVVMNHELGADQTAELRDVHGITDIQTLPKELGADGVWGNVPSDTGALGVARHLKPILGLVDDVFQQSAGEDSDPPMIIVGGELTACVAVSRHVEETFNVLAWTATSRRESSEVRQPDGSVVKRNVFKHVLFRQI